MALHACVDGFTVVELVEITSEEQYQEVASKYSTVLDVTPFVLKPEVGWILQGVVFAPPAGQQVDVAKLVASRIKHYQSLASDILVDMYVANTLAGITVEQSLAMFSDYADVLQCIREGAWPTALHSLSLKQPEGFVTQAMIDSWVALIQDKMV
jgi:hypothetical protein